MSDSNILWVPDEDDRIDLFAGQVMDLLPVMVWRGQINGYRFFHNEAWLEFTGRSSEEVKGYGWKGSVHPEDMPDLTVLYENPQAEPSVRQLEYRLRHKDGTYHRIREVVRFTTVKGTEFNCIGCVYDIQEEEKRIQQGDLALIETEKNRQQLQVTLSSIGDGVITTDVEGHVTYMNPVAEDLTGWTAQQSQGRNIQEVFNIYSEDSGVAVSVPVQQVVTEGHGIGLANHTVLLSRDGVRRPISDSAAPIRTGQGDMTGVVMVFQDMTYKREAEARIETLLDEYEMIFSGVTTPLFMVDVDEAGDFPYRRFNPANERLVGLSSEQILGLTPVEIFGQEMGEDIVRQFQICVDSREPHTYVARRQFASGPKVQMVRMTPVIRDNRVVRLVGSAFDLTEQALMEEALRDSEERFRLLFDNLEDMACVYSFIETGPAGPFLEVNRTMQEALGYDREEFLTMTPADLDPTEDMETVYGDIRREFARTRKSVFQVKLRTRDGRVVPAEARATLIHYQGRLCVLATLRDITTRLVWEERLQHHLTIEKAITQVLNLLIRQEQVSFNEICEILGEAVGCSTSFIYLFDDEEVCATKIAQWTAPHVSVVLPIGRKTDTRRMTWYANVLREEGIIVMADVQNMPKEAAAEKEDLVSGQIKSILNVAFFTKNGHMKGFMGFTDHGGPREWLTEDIELLRSVAEVMGIHFDRQESEEKIRHISFHDQVTGLYNRAFFEEELQRLDTLRQLPLSILIGDVNGLKLINDAFGHNEGDRFLAKIARTLERVCRHEDVVARWGGDEFIILLPQTDEKAGSVLIDRIRRAMEEEEDELLVVSMALGVATKEDPKMPVNMVIREAEDRMYRNKMLESQSYRSAVISSLESTLWERSNETEEHTRRMQSWAVRLGKKMGLTENRLDELKLLTSLHDIGKIAIPDHILNKPGPLTCEEWKVMRRHSEIGYRIASASNDLLPIANGILTHHEWWDGNGYPQGLAGEEIPVVARIVAVVDSYDVMRHDRPYRKALTHDEALAALEGGAGTQFDPAMVAYFLSMLSQEESEGDGAV